ncbi:acyl carrier protein [Myceligenerans salitolerans]|uniref:Acyl carrier protein n=1 Tax=Myceligenerans salitolerans TaxID=1230528 RepID=A0ABS3IAL6_9MICO|nr:acyl carrier protein [Myceligenerans salitolerans]MBO0609092.1 acyl carrier protein [Myceligenerans salitolerans]
MSSLDDTTERYIKNLICDILDVNPSDVSETSPLARHGADSLATIEIITRLEQTLGITIERQDVPRMADLAGVYDVVAEAGRRKD